MNIYESINDPRKLSLWFAEQERTLKDKTSQLHSYKTTVKKLQKDSKALREEALKLSPERADDINFEENPEQSSEEEDMPEFISIDRIYEKLIQKLKSEKKALKKHVSQLLIIMNRNPDELDDSMSSNEWEGQPTNKNDHKLEIINPSITVFEPIPMHDDYRVPIAYKTGGLPLLDEKVQAKIRSVGKELVREIGRKLLNGDFNLTRISVPIKCMQAATALHNTLKSAILCPPYLVYAGSISDPIERMKLVVTSSMCSFYYLSTFEKPINPVLGETLYGILEDGAEMFSEQSCHHPPISHFHIEHKLYRLTGYFNFTAKAGLNSVTVTNSGKKIYTFPDGHVISQNCGEDLFGGTFFGQLRHDCHGDYVFTDHNYGNVCRLKVGVKDKLTDYLEGNITDKNGGVICKVFGSWIGYLDFDGVRYWDVRQIKPATIDYKPNLPSDSGNRKDLQFLKSGLVDEAQVAKEEIENLQRHDRKMREKYHPH